MGNKVRRVQNGYAFKCHGCNEVHVYTNDWHFNGNLERPSFVPSLMISSGHFVADFKSGDSCWCTHNAEEEAKGEKPSGFNCGICHLFVSEGQIQYCPDSTHHLSGKTVPMDDVKG